MYYTPQRHGGDSVPEKVSWRKLRRSETQIICELILIFNCEKGDNLFGRLFSRGKLSAKVWTGVYSKVTRKKIKRAPVDSCRAFIPNERFLTGPRDFSVSIVFPLDSPSPLPILLSLSLFALAPPPFYYRARFAERSREGGEKGAMLIPRNCLTAGKLVVSVLV